MAVPLGTAEVSLAGLRRDLSSLTAVSLKYYTVPLERLVDRTPRDLTHVELSSAASGRLVGASAQGSPGISGARLFLTGCITLTEHARASSRLRLAGPTPPFRPAPQPLPS